MPQFRYKAQTPDNKKVTGMMNAADEGALQQELHKQNLLLLSVKAVNKETTPTHTRRWKPKQLADFSRQLSTLVSAGVTLVRALSIIADGEAVKPREKRVYTSMLTLIRQGVALSDAMEAQGNTFPPLMIYMYRSAETGGNLDSVSMKMAQLYEKDHRLNAKISSSMTYPKILAVLIVGVVLVLLKFVLPTFTEMFESMDQLPLTTRILMACGDFVSSYWYLVILGILGIIFGARALVKLPAVRMVWHKIKIKAPIFGRLQKVICTARFARTLSSLYAAGIPIVTALEISRKTVGNDYVEQQFDKVIPFVRAGNSLSDGLLQVDGFVRKLADAIHVGEETGSLDTMLVSTADSMEYDADIAIGKMVSYVEPIMLIVMGIIVAFVLMAVFGALYGSYDAVAGMG